MIAVVSQRHRELQIFRRLSGSHYGLGVQL
jgi:hypothetical protein